MELCIRILDAIFVSREKFYYNNILRDNPSMAVHIRSYNSKYVTLNETQFFMFGYSVKSMARLAYIASNLTSSVSMSTNKCFSSQFIC